MSDAPTGKLALVTGSSRGIGRATALALADMGYDQVVNYFRNEEAAKKTADDLRAKGVRAEIFRANVGEEAELNALFDFVAETFGYLDVLVNNAISAVFAPLMKHPVEGFEETFRVNVRSAFIATQRAQKLFRKKKQGCIVNVLSVGSMRYIPAYTALGVSKAALEALTKYSAHELGKFGTRVNAVSGGLIDTESVAAMGPKIRAQAVERTPMGREGRAEDMADVIAFLCSEKARWINGQTVIADGGYTFS
ncbi:MAG: SDR family oxidoreductase [Candidatus Methylomirabilis sp.]|nr:SDR family oxidoreductase [Deltaproteobacteria bacterium]